MRKKARLQTVGIQSGRVFVCHLLLFFGEKRDPGIAGIPFDKRYFILQMLQPADLLLFQNRYFQ